MLATDYYHPRPSADVMGVELCAAFKNFFAIAVGWAAGRREKHGARPRTAPSITMPRHHLRPGDRRDDGADAPFRRRRTEASGACRAPAISMSPARPGAIRRLGRQLGLGLSYAEVKAGPMKDDTIEGAELGIAVARDA